MTMHENSHHWECPHCGHELNHKCLSSEPPVAATPPDIDSHGVVQVCMIPEQRAAFERWLSLWRRPGYLLPIPYNKETELPTYIIGFR